MALTRYVNSFLNFKNLKAVSLIDSLHIRTLFQTNFLLSTGAHDKTLNEEEKKLTDLLRQRFPKSKLIEVTDISGGCGSMYAIYVETSEFKNLRTVKQHQLVNEVLKQQIKSMHGLRIQTAVADD